MFSKNRKNNKPYRVFISYSRNSPEDMLWLSDRLRDCGALPVSDKTSTKTGEPNVDLMVLNNIRGCKELWAIVSVPGRAASKGKTLRSLQELWAIVSALGRAGSKEKTPTRESSIYRAYVWTEIGYAMGQEIPVVYLVKNMNQIKLWSHPDVPMFLKCADCAFWDPKRPAEVQHVVFDELKLRVDGKSKPLKPFAALDADLSIKNNVLR